MKRTILIAGLALVFVLFLWWSWYRFWFGFSGPPMRQDYFAYAYTNITFLMFEAVVGAGIVAFQQLRYLGEQTGATERNLRVQIYRDLLVMIDEFETQRHRIEDDLPKDTSGFDFTSLGREKLEELERVCRSFDKLGMMLAQGTVPLSFLLDFHTRGPVVIWHRLAPYVAQLRITRNQSAHFKQFQMLAIEAKKHRDKSYPVEETFVLSTEDEKMWTDWRKQYEHKFWL